VRKFWERTRFPIICFLVAIVLALIGQLLNGLFKATWLPALFWSLAATPFAVAFYRMRDINRVYYGAFELLIAFASLYVGIWRFASTPSPMSFEHVATVWLFLWVAIYFMVRALDNIGVGLRGSKYEVRWQSVFQQAKQNGEKA
jgi:hypothetical protein